eukprot:3065972-Pyramimonas_sp.AAC.1
MPSSCESGQAGASGRVLGARGVGRLSLAIKKSNKSKALRGILSLPGLPWGPLGLPETLGGSLRPPGAP